MPFPSGASHTVGAAVEGGDSSGGDNHQDRIRRLAGNDDDGYRDLEGVAPSTAVIAEPFRSSVQRTEEFRSAVAVRTVIVSVAPAIKIVCPPGLWRQGGRAR